jgi:hypothetical protein
VSYLGPNVCKEALQHFHAGDLPLDVEVSSNRGQLRGPGMEAISNIAGFVKKPQTFGKRQESAARYTFACLRAASPAHLTSMPLEENILILL